MHEWNLVVRKLPRCGRCGPHSGSVVTMGRSKAMSAHSLLVMSAREAASMRDSGVSDNVWKAR